uniref:Uncharacterized protein n=1 Tax=Cyprinus carpio TaxID=7962 RepID=A0A8C2IF82_CYPCA
MFIVKKGLESASGFPGTFIFVVPALAKHSYWFDFWMFLVFDVILFLIVYFVIP